MRKFAPYISVVMLLGLLLSGITQNQAAAQQSAVQPQQSASQPQQSAKPANLILDGKGAQPYVPSGVIDHRSKPLAGAPNPPAMFTNYRAVTDDNSICNSSHTNCSQHEPYIAVNPNNPLNVVAAGKDWRPEDGNQKHIWLYTTTDGGVSWANQGITYPVGSNVINSSDVIVQWDASGNVYANPLVYNGGQLGNYVTKSTDGGLTWNTAVRVDSGSDDKNWMNIDKTPGSPYFGRIYVCWWQTTGSNDYCSHSSDQGATWSAPALWGTIGQGFVYPVVQPNGSLNVFYNNNTLDLVRSTDGGNSFGSPITAASISGVYGNRGGRAWRVNSMQAAAAGPEGNLYLTWLDDRNESTTAWDIYFTRSTNNGTTWSAPMKVNDDTGHSDQFEPAISVAPNGRIDMVFMDMRNDTGNTLSDLYYTSSSDGGLTFAANQRVTDVNFNLNNGIPSDSNGCAGDYLGISSTNNDVWPVWTDTRNSDGHGSFAQDVYAGHLHIDTGTNTPTVTGTPPTATRTNTPTLTPTTTPTPCLTANIMQNPGFETGMFAPWVISDTVPPPVVSTAQAHSGTHSALLGTTSGSEPNGSGSIYQAVTVPAGGAILSYWYYPSTTDTITFDWQDAYIENNSGTILATVMHVDDNTQAWTNFSYSLAPFAGQTVRIVFLVHQDGFGDLTSMYVDDVAVQSITSCGTPQATNTPGGATNTPVPATSTATASATSTPVPATSTPLPATNTPGGPTSTPVAATNTPAPTSTTPPQATNTPLATRTVQPSVTPTDCPNPFVDINGNVFYTAIHYLYCRGVVNGTDATHYSPAGTSTRAQFAKVVVLGFGESLYTPSSGPDFTDVPPSYWAYVYIETGFHNGILQGFDAPNCTAHGATYPCYLPNLPITRGQLTKLVVVAAHYTPVTPGTQTFTDVPPSYVFYIAIETAHAHGVINGYPDGTFRPNNIIRRDEMAQIVYTGIINP